MRYVEDEIVIDRRVEPCGIASGRVSACKANGMTDEEDGLEASNDKPEDDNCDRGL